MLFWIFLSDHLVILFAFGASLLMPAQKKEYTESERMMAVTIHFEKISLAKWVTILTALILSASMALSILPTGVYAQDFDESDSPQTTEPAGQRSQVRLDEKLTDPTTV